MESVKTFVKQYAVLNTDYTFSSPSGEFKAYSKGDDFLLGGRYGYEFDRQNRGVIVKISEDFNHLIPEENFSFEEETEVISINRSRRSIAAP